MSPETAIAPLLAPHHPRAGPPTPHERTAHNTADAVPSCVTGILFGPLVANVLNPFEWVGHDTDTFIDFTMQLSRIVIGLQVLFTGVNLPKQYIRREWLSLTMLLLPIMTCAWLSVGLLIWAIIPGLTYLEALVISACVVPTDPVLANSICKGTSGGALAHMAR